MTGNPDLTNLNEATKFYDHRYSEGYMGSWPREKLERVKALVQSLRLPSDGVALDFGCGTGVFTELLGTALPGWRILGVEFSPAALKEARRRFPTGTFFGGDGCRAWEGRCDLVFSHHVLEHVSDIDAVAKQLVALLRPSGTMLHILPCGNPGSVEWRLCHCRLDGIDRSRGNRFFFEDEGHLRRLTSAEFESLWHRSGCVVTAMSFSNQLYGALKYYSEGPLSLPLSITKTEKTVGASGWLTMTAVRFALVTLWAVRRPVHSLREREQSRRRTLRASVVAAVNTVAWPVSAAADWIVERLASREWTNRRFDPRGSEMYVFVQVAGTHARLN